MAAHQPRFEEIGDRVYVARYPQWDVNVGLVLGEDAALVVDTRASATQGREVIADIAAVGPAAGLPVRHVVNTHVHFDHTFGNIAFPAAAVHAHELAAAAFEESSERIREAMRAEPEDCLEFGYTASDLEDCLATQLRGPDTTFGHGHLIDLGGRRVELRYGGRGHTDGDIAVRVIGAGVTFLGDLVEQSGPPSYGEDCWPLDWHLTLRWHLTQLDTSSVVVPGHGTPVDETFVSAQLEQVEAVAVVLREWIETDVPLPRALELQDPRLPWPTACLSEAIRRAYGQLRFLPR